MTPTSKTLDALGNYEWFVPFVDTAKAAENGNYIAAVLLGVTDISSGSIEKGVAETGMKQLEKGLVKGVARQAGRSASIFAFKGFFVLFFKTVIYQFSDLRQWLKSRGYKTQY